MFNTIPMHGTDILTTIQEKNQLCFILVANVSHLWSTTQSAIYFMLIASEGIKGHIQKHHKLPIISTATNVEV